MVRIFCFITLAGIVSISSITTAQSSSDIRCSFNLQYLKEKIRSAEEGKAIFKKLGFSKVVYQSSSIQDIGERDRSSCAAACTKRATNTRAESDTRVKTAFEEFKKSNVSETSKIESVRTICQFGPRDNMEVVFEGYEDFK